MDHDFVRREEPRLLARLTKSPAIPRISTGPRTSPTAAAPRSGLSTNSSAWAVRPSS